MTLYVTKPINNLNDLLAFYSASSIARPSINGTHISDSSKKPKVTSTNSLQVLSLSNKPIEGAATSTMDAHYEANYKEKTLIEINRNRLNRKIQNLETQINQPMIKLDKLMTLSWSGIPSCK